MRKEIIQTVIKPYMKRKAFKNKGRLFTKDLGLFQIEVEIQSQRYYKDEGSENFRIKYSLVCSELTELSGWALSFTGGSISEESSWIEINQQTDTDRLRKWLLCELDSMMDKFENLYSVEYLLEIWKKYNNDFQYLFLLMKFKPEQLKEWENDKIIEMQNMDAELQKLSYEKSEQEKREDCLDKEMKLGGLQMKIDKILSAKKCVFRAMDFIKCNINSLSSD